MRVFAYLDAGTGSLFVQAMLGIFLAGGVIMRSFFKKSFDRLRFAITRRSSEDEE